jgi:multidrug efflux pump
MKLSKLGVGLDQVASALNAANSHSPKGELSNSAYSYVLDDNDQLFYAKDYAPLIVAYNNGAPVRLSDVATVLDSQENILNAGSVNDSTYQFAE